jgi:hypothetical protein
VKDTHGLKVAMSDAHAVQVGDGFTKHTSQISCLRFGCSAASILDGRQGESALQTRTEPPSVNDIVEQVPPIGELQDKKHIIFIREEVDIT